MTAIIQYIKMGFVLLIFLQTQNCEDKNHNTSNVSNETQVEMKSDTPLEAIHLKRYGGMMGHEENLRITQDSIYYSFKNREIYKAKELQKPTPVELWESLTQSFDADELPKVKDGEMKVAYDGQDNIFTLEGDFDSKDYRNPTENPTDLNPFFEIVNKTRAHLYDEIRKR